MLKVVKLLIFVLALCALCAGCAGSPGSRPPPKDEPLWIGDVDQVYSRLRYMATVGYGPSRAVAEKEAFASMISVFGQTVRVDRQSIVGYQEALLQDTVASYIRDTEITSAIKTSAGLDTLIGAEIRDYWYDGRDTHYALAVMEKSKAAALYSDLVSVNREIIGNLTTMTDGEKYSLGGYVRFLLAAKVADGNRVFVNILSVLGGAAAPSSRELADAEQFRLEAQNIVHRIPVDVLVDNDSSGRIQGAFAAVIGKKGFLSGGQDSRYVLDVTLSFSPVELPDRQNKFVRYELAAKLLDRVTGNVLLPYTASGREGHLTVSEAENRAIRTLETEISDAWDAAFSAYLDSLVPQKN
ncbi:MAG: LPP20 family lipoprotein [Treponema sp.]|nr:LPP20 family lipoprotein [Treponema sp.]